MVVLISCFMIHWTLLYEYSMSKLLTDSSSDSYNSLAFLTMGPFVFVTYEPVSPLLDLLYYISIIHTKQKGIYCAYMTSGIAYRTSEKEERLHEISSQFHNLFSFKNMTFTCHCLFKQGAITIQV